MIMIHEKILARLALLYLLLPAYIFILGWMNKGIGIIATGVFFLLGKAIYVYTKSADKSIAITSFRLIGIISIVVVFLLVAGSGNFISAAGYDVPWRNAIYYDLIHYSWPVIYDSPDAMLVYYHVFWLVPAGLSYLFGGSEFISNIFLFAWIFIGFFLGILLLLTALKAKGRQQITDCLIYLFWSGLTIFLLLPKSIISKHTVFGFDDEFGFSLWRIGLGGWHGHPVDYLIRTTFESVTNIYNQFIPIILCVFLFMLIPNRKYSSFLLGIIAIPYSPLGTLSFFAIGSCYAVYDGILYIRLRRRKIFDSIQKRNIIVGSIFSVFLVFIFAIYFSCNSTVGANSGIWYIQPEHWDIIYSILLSGYYIVYFGIFYWLIYREKKGDLLYWFCLIILLAAPLFKLGNSGDFGWNVSIVPYYILMYFVTEQFNCWMSAKYLSGQAALGIFLLAFVVITPLFQMTQSLRTMYLHKQLFVVQDIKHVNGTLGNKPLHEVSNFMSGSYRESLFYRLSSK